MAGQRRVVKPFTFSNGVTVPAGARIGAPTIPLQFDETVYENPNQFDGFRFHKLREQEGDAEKHQASTASINYLHFGLGHHVWYPHPIPAKQAFQWNAHSSPGRFFAIHEIKTVIAMLISRFDIKTSGGERPKDLVYGEYMVPDMKAQILFRRRGE